jgi:hypothetical protein
VKIDIVIMRVMTSPNLVGGYQRSGGISRILAQSSALKTLMTIYIRYHNLNDHNISGLYDLRAFNNVHIFIIF